MACLRSDQLNAIVEDYKARFVAASHNGALSNGNIADSVDPPMTAPEAMQQTDPFFAIACVNFCVRMMWTAVTAETTSF